MKDYICERVVTLSEYILENKATIRKTAKKFGVSKSTVHKDLTERLKMISPTVYSDVQKILETNKKERHIRGGNATKIKYMKNAT